MPTSPSTANLHIGKGTVSFKQAGEGSFRHIGNVPEIEFTPEIDKLEHFSSMEGVRTKDRTVVREKKGTLRVVFEEITPENLAMALIGDLTTNTGGLSVIDIFSSDAVSGELKFTGTNDVGSRFEWHFLNVEFIPSGGIPMISEEWMQVEITGDVAAVDGAFGTVTELSDEAT